MKFVARWVDPGLMPTPEYRDQINLRNGQEVTVETRAARNIGHHRKFFALMKYAWQNSDYHEGMTLDNFRRDVTRRAGYWEEFHTLNGEMEYRAKSIRFASMDQSEFEDLYSRCIDVLLRYCLPDTTADEVREIVGNIVGF